MPFTQAQKLRLMRAYAPVLYLHERERFVPISPTAYLERASLWDDQRPGSHRREFWGHPSIEGGALPPPLFPRSPLLRPGQLTVDPGEAGGDVHYLGEEIDGGFPFTESDAERALFLEFRGWWQEDGGLEFANTPGSVLETTQNRWAAIHKLALSWGPFQPVNPDDPIPPEEAVMEPFRRRLSADIYDRTTLQLAISQAGDAELGLKLSQLLSQPGNQNLWFLFFHFFYPAHVERLRWCEFVALLNNLGKELPDEPIHWPVPVDSSGHLSGLGDLIGLHSADYAGDWSTLCVMVPGQPEWLLTGPTGAPHSGFQELPEEDGDLPAPKYVGLGRRARSMVNEEGSYTFDQMMHVTDTFDTIGNRHVKVFAGLGTHNNFAAAGQHPAAQRESILDSACDVNGTDEDSDAPMEDKYHKRRQAALGLLKILGGLALGGLFGALAGAAAVAAEAIRDDGPEPEQGLQDGVFGPDEPIEEAPTSEAQALIIAPEEMLGELGLLPQSAWQIDNADVVDGQVWWPSPLGPDHGYQGAWGVTCAEDPFDARSGMIFPDVRGRLLESLAIFLETH